MKIYLVQSAGSLNGSDGYSYGLVHGDQKLLLVSFVDYMRGGKGSIHSATGAGINRRHIVKRSDKTTEVA